MVAQSAESQRHKLDTFELKGRTSFSHHDLDYKMKMLQLTLVYRRSVAEDRPVHVAQPNRHSIAQETFGKAKPMAIGQPFHRPKILAVEPKLKRENCAENARKPLVSITSATLPANSQRSKVQRLVRMFETTTNTAPKRCTRPNEQQGKSLTNHLPKVQSKVEEAPKEDIVVNKVEKPALNDEEIRAELKQRRKLGSV